MLSTYMIGGDGKWILCFECGRLSFNPGDVENHYCGYCHQFHETMARVHAYFDTTPAEEVVANAEAIKGDRNG